MTEYYQFFHIHIFGNCPLLRDIKSTLRGEKMANLTDTEMVEFQKVNSLGKSGKFLAHGMGNPEFHEVEWEKARSIKGIKKKTWQLKFGKLAMSSLQSVASGLKPAL